MSNTPLEQNGINLAEVLEKVNALPSGGITPSGSVTLTEERSYDVTDKATAVVDMSATRANLAEAVTAKGVDTLPTSSFDTIATNIGLISGGGSASHISKVEEFTHPEDWVTDTKGNAQNFVDTYFTYQQSGIYPFQIALIENNTVSGNYRANIAIYFRAARGNNATYFGRGTSLTWMSQVTTNVSFHISAGAKITVITLEHDDL